MPQMPIRQYVAQGPSVGGGIASPGGARTVDLSGVVNAANRAGAEFKQAQAELERVQEAERRRLAHNEAVSYATNLDSESDIKWTERLQTESTGDPNGMTERVLKDFDAYKTEALAKAPDAARPLIENTLARKRSQLHAQSFNIETKARQGKILQDQADGTEADAAMVLRDPSQFTDRLARRQATLQSLEMADGTREKFRRDARDRLVLAASIGFAQQYPAETLAALGAPGPHYDETTQAEVAKAVASGKSLVGIVPGMVRPGVFDTPESEQAFRQSQRKDQPSHPALGMLPFDKVDDILRVAKSTMERDTATMRVDLKDKARDVQAAVSSGLPVRDADVAGLQAQYVAAYGGIEGERRYHDEIGVPLLVGKGVEQLRSASPAERAAIMEGAKVKGVSGAAEQKGIYDALVSADSIIQKQIKDDPAKYAATTSPAVGQAIAGMQAAKTPEERRAAADNYAIAVRAEQQRLGVESPKLLTDSQSASIVKAFSDNPPEMAGDVIAGLESEWGKHWPAVYQQLAQEKKLTPAALVIPNMKDQGSRARMAAASAIKPEDLATMLQPSERKDLREKLQGQFKDGARTFMAQSVSGLQSMNTIMDQAEKLAIVYRSQGKGIGDAAQQAYDEVMGWKYTFVNDYRVPKEWDASRVELGAAGMMSKLDGLKLFITPYPMGKDNQTRQTLDALAGNAHWVTNEDESGLVLKAKGRDNNDYTVQKEDGARVELSFAELAHMGARYTSEGQYTNAEASRRRSRQEQLRAGNLGR